MIWLVALLIAFQDPVPQEPKAAGPLDAIVERIEKKLADGINPIRNSLDRVAERLEAIEARPGPDLGPLRAAIQDLAAKVSALDKPAADLGPVRTAIDKLTERLAAIESRPPADNSGLLAELRALREARAEDSDGFGKRLDAMGDNQRLTQGLLDRLGNLVWLIFIGVIVTCGTIVVVAGAYIVSKFRN